MREKYTLFRVYISSFSQLGGPMWDLWVGGSTTLKQGILPQERESGGVDFNRVGFVKSSWTLLQVYASSPHSWEEQAYPGCIFRQSRERKFFYYLFLMEHTVNWWDSDRENGSLVWHLVSYKINTLQSTKSNS